MQTFKEFTEIGDDFTDANEALTIQQRQKRKASFKKNKAKILMGKKKAAKKLASPDKLKSRAEKQARNIIIKKILKNKGKEDLSFAGRQELEKKVAKKKSAIAKIAKKLLPIVKKADRARLKAASQGADE